MAGSVLHDVFERRAEFGAKALPSTPADIDPPIFPAAAARS
jgi:hypothetical protein